MENKDSDNVQAAGISLLPVDTSDVPALASVHSASFRSDQYLNLMLLDRDENANVRFITKAVEMWIADPNAELIRAVDATGSVVGWACWIVKGGSAGPEETAQAPSGDGQNDNVATVSEIPPNSTPKEQKDTQEQQQQQQHQDPSSEAPARILSKLMQENLARKEQETMTNQRYLVLQGLATHPRCQRQGVGSKLVQQAVDRADELGISCWTQASPASHTLYARFGFQEVGRNDYDLDEWAPGGKGSNRGWGRYTFRYMVRPAKQV